ncbi:MAG TPA: magnesium/cobalt transporter CorA [Nocardioides sp.]|uniref:magnesium/cobalt transporter CorA n=1 Tax=Nocardioides sp. TaxID=35761 RepID=UPI002B7CD323|nr:magnesium/cobalt transporter CorA [Nocardioides sp.]HQR26399.1 magnesium/cobalt transporter CorA [Nocardioides sp.]
MIVDCALYHRGTRVAAASHPRNLAELGELRSLAQEPGDFIWVGLHEPSEPEIEDVAIAFGLHPLAVEDAINAHQRPKLELYEGSLFLTVKTVWYVDEEDAVETGEINIFMGPDFVVTVRHGEGSELSQSRALLENRQELLSHGPASVVYAVCDLVVDAYESVAAALEMDVDEVETSVFSQERTRDSARIYVLKREIAEMRRAVLPLRDPVRRLATGQVPGVPPETGPFFRDVADHLVRVSETIDSLDLLLSAVFEAHLAGISVQQNEDMRKISAGVGLVAVPTLIAGVYGMNFRQMPELGWEAGYPMAITLMVVSSVALWIFFKRSGWL